MKLNDIFYDNKTNILIAPSFSNKQILSSIRNIFKIYNYLLPQDINAKIVIKPNLNSNMNSLTGNTTDLENNIISDYCIKGL